MGSPQFPRRFVAAEDRLDQWSQIEPYFDALRDRPLDTLDQLVRWLEDVSELAACINEVGVDREVKMSCRTDDPERKQAYFDFLENIEPHCKPRFHELEIKYTQCPLSAELPPQRYAVLDRSIRAHVELFREKNIPLQTQDAKLSQRYQELCGAQMVEFEGQEQTMQQLARYAEVTDRDLRQRAWEAGTTRRLQDASVLEDLFEEMIQLRQKLATNADCADYRAYAWREKQRFDYTPEDGLAFHDAIEQAVVPVFRTLQEQRKVELALDPLRPWDTEVDVKGREPLRPFETVDELCSKTSRIFHRVAPELGDQFDEMQAAGYLDLESRKGKAPGGYQASYEESRHPFIFMNAVGLHKDVATLLHEGGHAFHQYACRHDPIVDYRSSPIEFAEVASFSMELVTIDMLDEFYEGEELARAKRQQLERVIWIFPWVATIDAFQHFLYTKPDHSRDERRRKWLELRSRFGGIADYTGYEAAMTYLWQRQLHLYQVPFYYIEYAIAKLGALQVWCNARRELPDAITKYRAALALGGSRPLPELFETAGAKFDFSRSTLEPLVAEVKAELDRLPA